MEASRRRVSSGGARPRQIGCWSLSGLGDDDVPIEGGIELLATIFASAGHEAGYALDGTLSSVAELDRVAIKLLDGLPSSFTWTQLTDEQRAEVENFIQGAGAYFGKTIVDHFGGSWVRDGEGHLGIVGLADLVVRPFQVAADVVRKGCEGGSCAFSALLAGIHETLA